MVKCLGLALRAPRRRKVVVLGVVGYKGKREVSKTLFRVTFGYQYCKFPVWQDAGTKRGVRAGAGSFP